MNAGISFGLSISIDLGRGDECLYEDAAGLLLWGLEQSGLSPVASLTEDG